MNDLTEEQRAKILGQNAARLWNFDVDKLIGYRSARLCQLRSHRV